MRQAARRPASGIRIGGAWDPWRPVELGIAVFAATVSKVSWCARRNSIPRPPRQPLHALLSALASCFALPRPSLDSYLLRLTAMDGGNAKGLMEEIFFPFSAIRQWQSKEKQIWPLSISSSANRNFKSAICKPLIFWWVVQGSNLRPPD